MKKFVLLMGFVLLFLVGCADMMNTPTKRVEEFLGKYQIMDHEVTEQLDHIIEKDDVFSDDQKTKYKALMEKQYQNLSYKIKDETIDGDTAEVVVEISVFDYQNAVQKAEDYIEKNQDQFETDGKRDTSKEKDYQIEQMESVVDKVQYTLNFTVHKDEDKKRWVLDDPEDDVILKLHGLYSHDN